MKCCNSFRKYKGKGSFQFAFYELPKSHSQQVSTLTNFKDEASIKTDDTDIKSSSSKKLLGVIIDNKLTFNEHVSKLWKKTSNKLHALVRISKYMTKDIEL